jgi:TRAP-type C4-dicarboxylate transport system permease small subunit
MTRADFLIHAVTKRSARTGHAMEAMFLVIGLLVMLVIAWSGWKPLTDAYRAREFFGVQGLFTIPTWPIRAVIVFGSLLTAIVYVVQAASELKHALAKTAS